MKKILEIAGKDVLKAAWREALESGQDQIVDVVTLNKVFFKIPKGKTEKNFHGTHIAENWQKVSREPYYTKGFLTGEAQAGEAQPVTNIAMNNISESDFGKKIYGCMTIQVKILASKEPKVFVAGRFDKVDSTKEDRFNAPEIKISGIKSIVAKVKEVYTMNGVYFTVKSAK